MADALPVSHYLSEAVLAERSLESQFRGFAAAATVDPEVQAIFQQNAEDARAHQHTTARRLSEIGAENADGNGAVAALAEISPKILELMPPQEEVVLQHLLTAYTVEAGVCGLYEGLVHIAHAGHDASTEKLAREIQGQKREAADKIWHFLASRSKIAFNMLTVNEVDPAVETKMADDRVIEP